MPRVVVAVLALALAMVATPVAAGEHTHCPPGIDPHYVHGFLALSEMLGQDMGDPITCEHADPRGTGDVHQMTTEGLAFWRKATNTPTFTNGWEHWAITEQGLVYWLGDSIDPIPEATPVEPPAGTMPPPTAPAPPPEHPGAPAAPTFGDGTHLVNVDILPGTYRTMERDCYWARLSGTSGELSDIIANGNTAGPEVVAIAETDVAFESWRCGVWSQNLSPITSSTDAPFGDGMYIVGTDVEAGTWQAPGDGWCYWARLSGFSGEISDIITNQISDGPVVVTIAEPDAGFTTVRCGEWTKIG